MADVLKLFEQDEQTKAVAIFGEIGGTLEEEAADAVAKGEFTKPLVVFIAGAWAPEGMRFSHASSIVERGRGTAQGKIKALTEAKAHVVDSPDEIIMPVMRSVFYVPSNNEKMVGKAPTIACDVLTLDLEDSVPPAEKPKGREMIQQYLKSGRDNQVAPSLYVRINNWETQMTNDDLEAIVYPGLNGVCLAKCGDAENVKRLDWKLEDGSRQCGYPVAHRDRQRRHERLSGRQCQPTGQFTHFWRRGLYQRHAGHPDVRGTRAALCPIPYRCCRPGCGVCGD
jgi:hypothetical protein